MSTETTDVTDLADERGADDEVPHHDDARKSDSSPPTNPLAEAVSIASDFGAVWIVVAAFQVLTGRATALEAARRLGAAGIVSLALTRTLKHHYAVPRADDASPATLARTPTSTSFPSGHTLTAFTAALTVPRRPFGRLLGLGFASLVAWARVRVGHHRPVDVVAGAAVGTLAGTALAAMLSLAGPDDD